MTSTLLTPVKWSPDDYHQMIMAGVLCDRRVELIDGDIVETAPVEPVHEGMGDAITEHLRERLGRRVLVRSGKAITLPTVSQCPMSRSWNVGTIATIIPTLKTFFC